MAAPIVFRFFPRYVDMCHECVVYESNDEKQPQNKMKMEKRRPKPKLTESECVYEKKNCFEILCDIIPSKYLKRETLPHDNFFICVLLLLLFSVFGLHSAKINHFPRMEMDSFERTESILMQLHNVIGRTLKMDENILLLFYILFSTFKY